MKRHDVHEQLARVAGFAADTGSGIAALVFTVAVIVWFAIGLANGFSQSWSAVLYSAGAAITLVMVFVIQWASHRQARAVLLKLDELIRANESARDAMIGVETAPVTEQERLEQQMREQADK